MKSRYRFTAAILFASAFTMGGFQNCSDMKASGAFTSSSFRMGNNGEKITEYQPTSMFTGGGFLTVMGENFTDNTDVTIDGAACLEKQLVSATEIRCRVPALAPGTKSVNVAGATMPATLTFVDFSKVNSVAGRSGISGGIDGVGRLARLTQVGSMTSDGEKIYFSEPKLQVIRSLDLNTFETKTIAGAFYDSNGMFADGVGTAARFADPSGLAVKSGTLYIADRENCVIRKMNLSTAEVSVLVGTPRPDYYDPCPILDGASGVATIGRVQALLVDGNNLYFSDKNPAGNALIRQVNLTTLAVTTVAGASNLRIFDLNTSYDWTVPAASLTQERLLTPALETTHPTLTTGYEEYELTVAQPGAKAMRLHFTQLAMGADDQLELTDKDGLVLYEQTELTGSDFWTPVFPVDSITIDSYFYDGTYGFKVDKIQYTNDASVPHVHKFDGPAIGTPVGSPAAMVKIGDDIYFSDSEFRNVRKLNLTSKMITAVTGQRAVDMYSTQGKYNETTFAAPMGLAADSRYLYISDMGDGPLAQKTGERILKMDLVTRESSVLVQSDPAAGNPANIDGPLSNAAVMQPSALVYDSKRGLFFDCRDVIRRIK